MLKIKQVINFVVTNHAMNDPIKLGCSFNLVKCYDLINILSILGVVNCLNLCFPSHFQCLILSL